MIQFLFKGSAALGKVDCEAEVQIASDNGISKYPTLKVYRNGKVSVAYYFYSLEQRWPTI